MTQPLRDKLGRLLPGNKFNLGRRHSDATKKKLSENNARPFLGKTHTVAIRLKMSQEKVGVKNPQYRPELDQFRTFDWLHQKYVIEDLSLSVIAKQVGVDIKCIQKWLIKVGIPRRRCGSRTKEKNHHWKGGRTIKSAYIRILSPNHPRRSPDGRVPEHVLVVEAVIGRLVKRGWVIHHCDENKHNNSPSNLYIFESRAEHSRHHRLNPTPFLQSNLSMYR